MADNVDGLLLGYAAAGTAYTGTFTNVASIQKITLNKATVKDVDTTTLVSTEQWEESVGGRKNAGSLSLTILYAKAATTTLFGLLGTVYAWNIKLIENSEWTCDGYINEFGHSTAEGDKVKTEISIKLTGKPVFTAA